MRYFANINWGLCDYEITKEDYEKYKGQDKYPLSFSEVPLGLNVWETKDEPNSVILPVKDLTEAIERMAYRR